MTDLTTRGGYTVTIKVANSFAGNGAIPHAFVTISGPGIEPPVTVGYYPQVTSVSGAGTVRDDALSHIGFEGMESHPYDQFLTFNVSPQQALNAVNFAASAANNPGQYQLLGASDKNNLFMQEGYQCTGFVRDVARAAGIVPQAVNTGADETIYPSTLGGIGVSTAPTNIASYPASLIREFGSLDSNQVQPFRSAPDGQAFSQARGILYSGIAAHDPVDQSGIDFRIAPVGTVVIGDGSNGSGSAPVDAPTPVTPTVFNPVTALPNYQGTGSAEVGTYVIQPGDTVNGIAAKLGMTPTELGDYLKTQYGAGTDLNSIVAGRGLPVPVDKLAAYNEVSINGLDFREPGVSTTPTPPAPAPATPGPDAPLTLDTQTTPDGVIGPSVSNAQRPTNSQDSTNPGSADAINGHDHQSDHYTSSPGNVAAQPVPQDIEQALLDAFQNPKISPGPGTQYADAGSGAATDAGGGTPSIEPNPASAGGYVNGSDLQSDMATAEHLAQLQAASALGLINTIIGLQNWSQQSDLSHASTVVAIYNQLNGISGGALGTSSGLGNLGQLGAGLGFLSALESGNAGGIIANGVALGNALFDNAVSNAIGSALNIGTVNVVPGIGLLIALDSGDPVSVAASALAFIPGWGQAAAIFLTIAASMFEDDIPMKEGQAQAHWDDAGNVYVSTSQDTEGGGASATGWMNSIVSGVHAQLASQRDQNGQPIYSLIPQRLPSIGYQFDADGFNYSAQGHLYLKWVDAAGQEQTRYYDGAGNRGDGTGETLAGDFMQHAADAIVPAWEAQTILAHWQETKAAQGLDAANAQARQAAASGLPQEAADQLTQSFSALAFEVPTPGTATAAPPRRQGLIDIDGDGYLEQTQWIKANQALLAIDLNGDGLIGAGELLNIGGAGTARNTLGWLDTNHDNKLDARDPAFAAVRVWLDTNGSGQSEAGELQSTRAAGITAIDFGTNPPSLIRADGSSTALTQQQLTGDVLGVAYTATIGGLLEAKERGETVLHAVNTRLFDGDAAHMHGGDADTDGFADEDGHGQTVTISALDARLSSTSANTITNRSTQQNLLIAAVTAGATGATLAGQAPGQANASTSTITAGSSQVRSNPTQGLAFVPAAAATLAQAQREATAAMVRSAGGGLFGAEGGGLSMGALAAVAVGTGAVQWPTVASANSPGALDAAAEEGGSAAGGLNGTSATSRTSGPQGGQFIVAADQPLATPTLLTLKTAQSDPTRTDLSSLQTGRVIADAQPQSPNPSAADVYASNQAVALAAWAQTAINSVANSVTATGSSSDAAAATNGLTATLHSGNSGNDGNDDDVLLTYPTVTGELIAGTEDIGLRISAASLLANDITLNSGDPSQAMLRISAVGGPLRGQVALRTNEQGETEVVFIPEANYHGTAGFSYTVTDQYGLSTVANAVLHLAPVNDAPVAHGEAASGDEDNTLMFSAASLLANDSDVDGAVDGDVLRITRVGLAEHGQVFLDAGGQIRFVPDVNYNGPARFTYWVGDRDAASITAGLGYETAAVMQLTVLPVNDLPVVTGESIASDEDIVLSIAQSLLLANDSDVDTATTNAEAAQVLRISAVSGAQHGSVALLPDGIIQFTPEQDYFGAASFVYTVDDGHGGQVQATAVVNLAPVNDAPDVLGETVTFDEDEAQTIAQSALLANDSDVDNPHSDLRIVSVDNASHGTVSLNTDGSIRFAPAADYFGAASFTYTVSDGVGGFTVGMATLDILPVNDAPRLLGESLTTDEDQIVRLGISTLLGNDMDVDNPHSDLQITSVGNANNGTVQIVAGEIVFTPTLNFFGQASFSYTVSDGVGGNAQGLSQALVNLTFNSVNDAPVVNNELLMGKRNVSYTLSQAALLANDTDVESPTSLRIVGIQNIQHGTASLAANGAVTFTPEAGYAGRGSFEYVVQDTDGGQTKGSAEIDFSRINVNPVATDDSFTGYEDIAFIIQSSQLLANDADPDATASSALVVDAAVNASNGTVSLRADGSVRFDPVANFYGTASFQYRISDGEGGQTWATAYLNVQPVNDAPVIVQVWYGDPIDSLVTSITGNPEQGEQISYYPQDDPYRQNGGVIAYDPDGDSSAITLSIGAGPQHGHAWANVMVPNNSPAFLTYDAAPGYFVSAPGAWQYFSHQGDPYTGSDPFTITVTDGGGASTSAMVYTAHQGSSAGGGGKCPIVMDLNGNGIELIRPEDSNIFADVNGDGWRERIGWAGDEDGVLTFDANRDGKITDEAEVSFVSYKEGARTDLDGLAAFDTDGNGKLTAGDAAWSQFGVLRDANGNGRQDEGELVSLDQLGITAIGLQRQGSPQLDHGNVVFGTTDVEFADGRIHQAGDVMFAGQNVPLPPDAVNALEDAEIARLGLLLSQYGALASTQAEPLGYVNWVEVSPAQVAAADLSAALVQSEHFGAPVASTA